MQHTEVSVYALYGLACSPNTRSRRYGTSLQRNIGLGCSFLNLIEFVTVLPNTFTMSPVEWSFIQSLQYQFTNLPYPQTDCTGKTVIVTGASGGLGLEAARHFARLNAQKVILGCRSVEKGETAKHAISTSITDLGPDVIEVWTVDLGSFESVQEFCRRANDLPRLDYVIENAAVATSKYKQLEGYEETITVNVLSTYLMALLLLPVFRKTATRFNETPHLTIVSSDAHYFTSFPQRKEPEIFETLKGNRNMLDRYNISKLLEILIARELAKAIDSSTKPRIILNSVNPGYCRTEIGRNASFPVGLLLKLFGYLLARSPEMGSRTLMSAVFAGKETHGRYMGDCMLHDESRLVRSEEGYEAGRKAYAELLALLEGVAPGISSNV
ncbi:short-chain dehydrogenase/reductase-like protein [Xylariales sp. AK1849]|nr:short-chain dehydrogenase/reductase-like protein [Xylariales sp. AK1849]